MIRNVPGGVTAAQGFAAASAAAGIKYKDRQDMAMIYSKKPCVAAGTFTRNLVKAAPVVWDEAIIKEQEYVHAVVINAGIANACTGKEGMGYCVQTAQAAASILQISEKQVLVASTGVIGMQLPMERIKSGVLEMVPNLSRTTEAADAAAQAIMTTDTHKKQCAVSFQVNGKTVTVGGMCKGSGMIHPDMCTMLAFVTTDICISKELLVETVRADVKDTYNMISVDGDTSTNDTLLVLANGQAGNEKLVSKEQEGYALFCQALNIVNTTLAKMMAGDGEGATALFEVKVLHAKEKAQAAKLGRTVISSSLTKAAIFGHDANWGRILCAMGYSGVEFEPEKVDLYFESAAGRLQIMENGVASDYKEEEAAKILSEPEVTAVVDLKQGEACATAWGCDLTYDYVKINADYRS